MIEIYCIISSYQLIPQVELFLSEEEAKTSWIDFQNGECKDGLDYDNKNPEETWERGFAHWHDFEVRWEREVLPGVRLDLVESGIASRSLSASIKDSADKYTFQKSLERDASKHNDSLEELTRFANVKNKIDMSNLQDWDKKKYPLKWPRQCTNCGCGMAEGWVWGEGAGYACSEECLFIDGYTKEDLDVDYKNDVIYWTEWGIDEDDKEEVDMLYTPLTKMRLLNMERIFKEDESCQ